QLARDFPKVPQYHHELGRSHAGFGVLLRDLNKCEEAEAAFRDALKIHMQLARDFPTMPHHQNELARTMFNLALLLHGQKDFSQARKLLEGAAPHHEAALKANPDHPAYRREFQDNRSALAQTLTALGDHAGIGQIAEHLAGLDWDPGTNAYKAACLM